MSLEELARCRALMDRGRKLRPGLKYLRARRGLSQTQLATKIGTSQAYISLIECGARRRVSPRVLLRLAQALQVTVEALVAGHRRKGQSR